MGSKVIGDHLVSEWKGARDGHGPTNHFDVRPRYGAGGKNRVTGCFLYRNQASFAFDGGMWGLVQVNPTPYTCAPPALTTQSGSTSPTSPTSPGAGTSFQQQSTNPRGCFIDPQTGKADCVNK